ncbi:MAG: TetR/AcrR family transcriptional regulator [Reyranella sp.]|uniref:TetR/AcrR family transcriptional regulator n=1 Tax=Reyranella sp. TaxID=1929291 RepID=UPI003D0BC57E
MTKSTSRQSRPDSGESAVRQRILSAAFRAFTEGGYAGTSTLEIATRAQVSKATLYALVGNKQEILAACIGARVRGLRVPVDLPRALDREALADVLTAFGTQFLTEISDPAVVAVFRLAIAEATRAPEVARAVDSIGGEAIRTALRSILSQARSSRLLDGEPAQMAEHFTGLLWGNLMVGLLLGVADRPSPRELARRARAAADAILGNYGLAQSK